MIRKLRISDIEAVNYLGEFLYPNFTNLFDLTKIIKDSYTHVLVAERNSNVIGYIMFTKIYETIDIISIVVAENYRNKKIASSLIDYMISEYQDSLKLITLEVNTDNIAALKLYEKFGFEIIATREKYFNNKDSYLMAVKYK